MTSTTDVNQAGAASATGLPGTVWANDLEIYVEQVSQGPDVSWRSGIPSSSAASCSRAPGRRPIRTFARERSPTSPSRKCRTTGTRASTPYGAR